jgi:hypothetical protein
MFTSGRTRRGAGDIVTSGKLKRSADPLLRRVQRRAVLGRFTTAQQLQRLYRTAMASALPHDPSTVTISSVPMRRSTSERSLFAGPFASVN